MIYGNSLSSLSLVSLYSGGISLFSLAHGRWRSRPDCRSTGSSRAPQYLCNTEYAQFVDMSEIDNGGVQLRSVILFMRDVI